MAARKKGLGRGLDALLGADVGTLDSIAGQDGQAPLELPLTLLQGGRYQPRSQMDDERLKELAASIRAQGVIQPIVVRPARDASGLYEIIAGERRHRAARLAGLKRVPVRVQDVTDESAAVMALIENIQREDLNPLEEAQAVRRLLDEFGMTHEQAAAAIGRSRSATSNLLRLLNLAEPVRARLQGGEIDMGHARALLALDAVQQEAMAREVVVRGLSVRETERRVARLLHAPEAAPTPGTASPTTPAPGADLKRLEQALAKHLDAAVHIRARGRRGGQLVIDFRDHAHLLALLHRQGLEGSSTGPVEERAPAD